MDGLMTTAPAGATMTSLEIAELVGSRHDSVKRTIERLAAIDEKTGEPVIALPPLVDVQETGGNNRTYVTQAFVFSGEQGRLDSITVVAQLSATFTARMVKRWDELEKAAREPVTDLDFVVRQQEALLVSLRETVELRRRVAENDRKIEATAIKVIEVERKAEDALAAATGESNYMALRGFASNKGLAMTERELAAIGGELSRKCKAAGIEVKKRPHEIWGKVNLYPLGILNAWYDFRQSLGAPQPIA